VARSSTTFKAGQSGNPHGRPAVAKNIQELARQHTSESVEALLAALRNPGERVRAAEVLLAYGYGRPIQTQNIRVISDWAELSDAEVAALAVSGKRQDEGTRH
jgi:hypothetical protein